MQNQSIQFVATSPQQLQREISESVKIHLDEFLEHFKPQQPKEYLTKADVAKMLSINICTVHSWMKSGKLKSFGINNRVTFLQPKPK